MSLRRFYCALLFFTPWVAWADDKTPSPVPSSISSAIRASLPAYAPPPPVAEKETSPTSTENIIFLNKVVVSESQLPRLSDWQMLSNAGKAAYLKKTYPGAALPGNALTEQLPNYATLMQREDARKTSLKEMDESADLDLIKGDVEASKKLKEETQRALIRNPDWKTESMDKSYNNGRR